MCELWIRTQDKTRLLKVSEIELLNEYYITTNYYAMVLGEYSTKERAMEVLDEIQTLLMGDIITFKNIGTPEEVSKVLEDIKMKGFCWYTKNYPDEHSDNDKPAIEFLHRGCVVYQMPEDVKESE